MSEKDTTWPCEECGRDVVHAQTEENYVWREEHGWFCGECKDS